MRYSSLYSYIVSLAIASVLLAGCSNGGGDTPKPDPREITKPIMAKDSESGQALDQLTFVVGSDTTVNVSKITLTRKEGTSESVTIIRTGYRKKTQTIHFESGEPVTIALEKDSPDEVTITLDPQLDGKTDADAEIFSVNTDKEDANEKLGEGKTTLKREKGTKLGVRITGPDITPATKTLVFDKTKPVTVTLEAKAKKTVTLRITPEIDAFDAKKRGTNAGEDEHTKYRITVGEKTFTNRGPDGSYINEGKPLAVAVAAGSAPITISGRFVYFKASGSYSYAGVSLAEGETSVSPDGDRSLTLSLEHQPACSDGINNDFATDDVADENDSGCVKGFASHDPSSDDFVYEPDDDNEVLLRVRQGGALTTENGKVFVSSAEGNRSDVLYGVIFPKTASLAVGQINLYLKNRIDERAGQEFAARLNCGPESEGRLNHDNPHTTDIVPDDQSVDGWRTSLLNGMTREWLSQGRDCLVEAVDGTLARGKDADAGDDDVLFYSEDTNGSSAEEWYYEEEEVQ